ncbi:MAG: 4-hydroxy-tetrahydrodipicolinate reductase [Rhodospirillales bacterium]|jgi:4-hydroxy-tetrahydrodipicolinate reductase|nr:4-hydroxy-tetrahydrodipicolinate reductase [Rhodospirillales bacterium]
MRIAIAGAAGRMGRMLIGEVLATPGAVLAGGIDRADHPAIGADIGVLAGAPACGLILGGDPSAVFSLADAVIDFSTPAGVLAHARLAAETGTALVVGVTGLAAEHQAALAAAGAAVPVVQAANMSVGVNLLLGLTRQVAATLGADYDIEIVEMHHRHKVDAPSGTALALGEAAAHGRRVRLADVGVRSRDGHTGARPAGAIGFATLRGGDVVGEHTVIFAAEGERVELTHKASSRAVFAKGAVRAAMWTAGRSAGVYGMADVLGLA